MLIQLRIFLPYLTSQDHKLVKRVDPESHKLAFNTQTSTSLQQSMCPTRNIISAWRFRPFLFYDSSVVADSNADGDVSPKMLELYQKEGQLSMLLGKL